MYDRTDPLFRGMPLLMWCRPMPSRTPRMNAAFAIGFMWSFAMTGLITLVAAPPAGADVVRVLQFVTITVACALTSGFGFDVVMRGDDVARRTTIALAVLGGVTCAFTSGAGKHDPLVEALCVAIALLTVPLVLLLARPFASRA